MGFVDVEAMMATISERQFREWWAFHLFVEPLESVRMDRRFGLLIACLEMMLCGESGYDANQFYLGYREALDTAMVNDHDADWRLLQAKMENLCLAFNTGE